MDENFRDTLRTNEIEDSNESMYQDPTHVDEIDREIIDGYKDDISIKLARWLRQKVYGVDVRETMARFVLWISVLYHRILHQGQHLLGKQNQIEKDFKELSDKLDSVASASTEDLEVILARTNADGVTYETLGERLNAMEKDHYTLFKRDVDELCILQDDRFSINHETVFEKEVDYVEKDGALIIAEIDNKEQDTFYFEEVGEF